MLCGVVTECFRIYSEGSITCDKITVLKQMCWTVTVNVEVADILG